MAWHPCGTKPLPEPMLTFLMNKPQGNSNQNKKVFIQENAIKNVAYKMVILPRSANAQIAESQFTHFHSGKSISPSSLYLCWHCKSSISLLPELRISCRNDFKVLVSRHKANGVIRYNPINAEACFIGRNKSSTQISQNIYVFLSTCSSISFNSLAPGRFESKFINLILKQVLVIDSWDISCEIALRWMSLDLANDQWQVNIGSGNDSVPSGNKPLPEPLLTQSYDAIWHR